MHAIQSVSVQESPADKIGTDSLLVMLCYCCRYRDENGTPTRFVMMQVCVGVCGPKRISGILVVQCTMCVPNFERANDFGYQTCGCQIMFTLMFYLCCGW